MANQFTPPWALAPPGWGGPGSEMPIIAPPAPNPLRQPPPLPPPQQVEALPLPPQALRGGVPPMPAMAAPQQAMGPPRPLFPQSSPAGQGGQGGQGGPGGPRRALPEGQPVPNARPGLLGMLGGMFDGGGADGMDPRLMALLGASGAMLGAGGPSRVPVGLGDAMAGAIQGGLGGYATADMMNRQEARQGKIDRYLEAILAREAGLAGM